MYTIERGIPIPEKSKASKPSTQTAFLNKMKISNSVLVPKTAHGFIATAYSLNKKGKKFISRKVDADNVRIWRIK